MWLTRDKDGQLAVHRTYPHKGGGYWFCDRGPRIDLNPSKFPRVLFHNSPVRLMVPEEIAKKKVTITVKLT